MKKAFLLFIKIILNIYVFLSSLIICMFVLFENDSFFSSKKLITYKFSGLLDKHFYLIIFCSLLLILITILILIIRNNKFQLLMGIFIVFFISILFFLFILFGFTETWQVYDSHISHFSPLDPEIDLKVGINTWINYIFFLLINCFLILNIKPINILEKLNNNFQIKNLKLIIIYIPLIIILLIRIIIQLLPKPDDIFMFYTG